MFSSTLGFASQVFSLLALNQAKGSTYPPKCSLLMVGGKRRWWNERKRSHFLSFPSHSVMFFSISYSVWVFPKLHLSFLLLLWLWIFFVAYLTPKTICILALVQPCKQLQDFGQRIALQSESTASDAWTSLKWLSNHLLKSLLRQLVLVVRQPQSDAHCHFSFIPCLYMEDSLLDSFTFLAQEPTAGANLFQLIIVRLTTSATWLLRKLLEESV